MANTDHCKTPGKDRFLPATVATVVGMLESSAHLDDRAAAQREKEAENWGVPRHEKWQGRLYEVVDLPSDKSYSLGITLGAAILAAHAAELALKLAFESEHPCRYAPRIHDLEALYSQLSPNRRAQVEVDYTARNRRHGPAPDGWQTAKQVFRSSRDSSAYFRYLTQGGPPITEFRPVLLREAVCSVLASIGITVGWRGS